jgi:3-oxoacyl-[acyl-carrier protein] reductase
MAGCRVFVTGGDRGIGRAVVLRFAEAGCSIALSYRVRRDAAEEAERLARERGAPETLVLQLDVSSPESVAAAAGRLREAWSSLNVLVNNAGVIHFGTLEETSLEDWERVIRVNLTGPFLVTKALLPLLERADWASIVNIASIAGETGNVVASAAYAASKAGLIGLTRRLAVELAPKGIRVNAVAPSFVETDMVRGFIDTPEKRRRVEKLHPLRMIIQPRDVAEAVYFLAMPETARAITGQVLRVNAGRLTC